MEMNDNPVYLIGRLAACYTIAMRFNCDMERSAKNKIFYHTIIMAPRIEALLLKVMIRGMSMQWEIKPFVQDVVALAEKTTFPDVPFFADAVGQYLDGYHCQKTLLETATKMKGEKQ